MNTASTNGTAAIDASGSWTYTPANYNGIDYADSALNISKESGRNQVTHWTSAIQKN
ncbi:MAG: hypothetical protein K0U18_08035 [Betaproteobacteria bacterium]|nr:hypothetical protein [Betaproteobacteria bacterium]MCH9849802.1 hypothetical protein [Betaproteobacteria bacterium]